MKIKMVYFYSLFEERLNKLLQRIIENNYNIDNIILYPEYNPQDLVLLFDMVNNQKHIYHDFDKISITILKLKEKLKLLN